MISLHDYSKSKDNGEALPTLLNDLNKLVEEEFEIVYIKPQEITIFQVFDKNVHIVICAHNRLIFNTGNKQKIQKVYWINKYYLQTTI